MTQPDRYRHRTPEVEAVQWTGSNADALRAFAGADFDEIELDDRTEDPDETAAVREAAHGTWRGLKPGDWVVKLDGGLYEFAAADFAEQYEPAGVAPVTARPVLRDRAAAALHAHDYPGRAWPPEREGMADAYRRQAAAVLAVLPASVDRAAALREAADAVDSGKQSFPETIRSGASWAARMLRRMADETQPEAEPGTCGHRSTDGHPCNEPPGHLGYHRNARQGGNEWTSWVGDGPVIEETECCGAEPPDGWPGDCWCTLPPDHDGGHRCEPCSNRHDAPGWTDEPPAVGAQQPKEA